MKIKITVYLYLTAITLMLTLFSCNRRINITETTYSTNYTYITNITSETNLSSMTNFTSLTNTNAITNTYNITNCTYTNSHIITNFYLLTNYTFTTNITVITNVTNPDLSYPIVDVTAPQNLKYVGETFTISGTAYDGSGISNIVIMLSNTETGTVTAIHPDMNGIHFSTNATLSPGNYRIKISATDNLGNTTQTGDLSVTVAATFGTSGEDRNPMITKLSTGYLIACIADNDLQLYGINDNLQVGWSRSYGGSGWEQTTDLISIPGGACMVGSTTSFGAGNADVWVLNFDETGNTNWSKTYGGSGFDYGYGLCATSNGGFLVAGSTESIGYGSSDAWLLFLNSDGSTNRTKHWGTPDADEWKAVLMFNSTNVFLAGLNGETNRLWFVGMNTNGNTNQSRFYGGDAAENVYSVCGTSDGGIAIAAETYSYGAGYSDIWIIHCNPDGTTNWSKVIGQSGYDRAYDIISTSDGDILAVGMTSAGISESDMDGWAALFDLSGNVIWEKHLGGASMDTFNSVTETASGEFVIVGETLSFGDGSVDIWTLMLGDDGSILK